MLLQHYQSNPQVMFWNVWHPPCLPLHAGFASLPSAPNCTVSRAVRMGPLTATTPRKENVRAHHPFAASFPHTLAPLGSVMHQSSGLTSITGLAYVLAPTQSTLLKVEHVLPSSAPHPSIIAAVVVQAGSSFPSAITCNATVESAGTGPENLVALT